MSNFKTEKLYNKSIDKNAAELIFTSAMVKETSVSFYAFLTSFTQQFSSEWNVQNVYGRIDPVANFRGNVRTLNLAWDVPAGVLGEAKENLEKFKKLTQMIYPYYSKGATSVDEEAGTIGVSSNALSLAKSPLIRLKFANLISDSSEKQPEGLLGYITSLSWNPVLEMGMFTNGGSLYPKVVSLNVSYSVLHEHELGFFPDGSSNTTPSSFPFGG
jgi:hypothetical protein